MSFRKYEEYKESGVEWLGEVPKHWSTQAVWMGFELGRGRVISKGELQDNPGDYPVYSSQTEREGEFGRLNTYDFDGHYITWTTDGAHAGTTFERRGKFNCTNVCGTLKSRTQELNLTFYRYAIDVAAKWYVRHDINPKLMNNVMASIRIPKLPLAEQNQIAAFLDKETTNTDTLIDKQEQLITLLQEKRQAIISHAVTRGLNPNVRMKDSGIEWLEDVPEHWVISHLRWFISIKSGEGLSNSQFSKETLDEDSYPVIGGNGTMGYSRHFNTTQKAFAIGRVGALCGNVHFLKEKCWITDNALKISKWEVFNDSYFEYMLKAANLNQYANQSAQPLITGEQVKALPVPRLPLEEQKQIAAFLDKETTKIDALIEKCETAIELLKERRTALISAAVTGKIDVRNVG